MRMTFDNLKLGKYFGILPMFMVLLFAGCEIGLGGAIDTESPKINIITPDVNTTWNDSIEVTGKCSDDSGVELVEIIRIYNSENSALSWEHLGSIKPVEVGKNAQDEMEYSWKFDLEKNPDGTYTCKTDSANTILNMVDGTYIVDVRSFDSSGRQSTIDSRVFDIDTTAPFLLLSSPKSFENYDPATGEENPNTTLFGRSVTLRGVTSDNHEVPAMTVTAYRDAAGTNQIFKKTFTGFDKATTAVTIAAYSVDCAAGRSVSAEIRELHNNYMALFNRSSFTDVNNVAPINVYLSIELKDSCGNVAGYTYSNEKLLRAIRGEIGVPDARFEASDGSMILSGTYNRTDFNGTQQAQIKNLLTGNSAQKSSYLCYDNSDDGKNLIVFNVTPSNAAKYRVSNMGISDSGTYSGEATTSSVLGIEFMAGRDRAPIDPPSISVKISDASNPSKYVVIDKDHNPGCFTSVSAANSNDQDPVIYPVTELKGITGGTFNLNLIDTGFGFVNGSKYKVEVFGKDVNGVDILSENARGYGFKVVSSGTAATVYSGETLNSKKEVMKPSSKIAEGYKVLITDAEMCIYKQAKALTYEICYYDGYYASEASARNQIGGKVTNYVAGSALTPQVATRDYLATIPLSLPATNKNITIIIKAVPLNGIAEGNQKTFILHSDGKAPSLIVDNDDELKAKKINALESPYFKKVGDKYQYTLSGKVSDIDGMGTKNILYKLKGDTEWKKVFDSDLPEYSTTENGWSIVIPFETECDDYSITLKAVDSVGNESAEVKYPSLVFGFGKPSVELKSVKNVAGAKLEPYYKEAVAIVLESKDNFSVSKVNAAVTKDGVNQTGKASTSGENTSNATTTISVPATDGKWRVELTAENPSGGISDAYTLETIIDTTAPVIDSISVSGTPKQAYTSTTLKIDGAYTEANDISKIEYWITLPDSTNTDVLTSATVDRQNKTFSITPTDFSSDNGGLNVLHVRAYDAANNVSAEKTLDVKIDVTAPKASVLYCDEGSGLGEVPSRIFYGPNKAIDITLYGLVSDEGGLASLDFTVAGTAVSPDISYTTANLTSSSAASAFTGATWTTALTDSNRANVKGWKARFTGEVSGVLALSAKDLAGLASSLPTILTFTEDSSLPWIEVTTPAANKLVTEDDLVDNKLVVSGKWSDSGSGTNILEWSLDGSSWVSTGVTDAPKGTATVSWSISIPKGSLNAGTGKTLHVRATDGVLNVREASVTGLSFDYSRPEISVSPSSLDEYYGKSASDLVITFTGTDLDPGACTIVLDSPSSGLSLTPVSSGKATLTLKRDGSNDGKWDIKAHAVDASGRESAPVSLSTTVDGTVPTFKANSTKVEENAYDADAWFKNNVIRVGAVAIDDESGISNVYYKLASTQPADVVGTKDGLVAAISNSPYTFTVNNLSDGANKVWMQIVDKAGNKSSVEMVQINVDQTNPSLDSKYYSYDETNFSSTSGTARSNKSKDLYIYGNVEDLSSGVASLVLKIGETEVPATVTYSTNVISSEPTPADIASYTITEADNTVKSYRAKISKTAIEQGTVRAIVTDKAGNSVQQTFFQIVADTTAPTIELKSPVTKVSGESGSVLSVNGTVTVTGSSNDEELASVTMEYSVNNGSSWNLVGSKPGSSAYNWSFNLPMTSNSSGNITFIDGSSYAGTSKQVLVKVTALDVAGNSASKVYEYNADPDGDRPVISFNNVSLEDMTDSNPVWFKSNTIIGNIRDDDGIMKLECKVGADSYAQIPVNSGTWSLPLTREGSNVVYFRVTDTAGTVFESKLSSAANQYSSPKLTDGENDLTSTSVLSLKVDTNPPEIGDIYYQVHNSQSDTYGARSKDFTTGLFGGIYDKMKLNFQASDTNGISSVSVKIDGKAGSYTATRGAGDEWTTQEIALDNESLVSGSYRIIIEVTDAAGAVAQKTVSFEVDNTVPAITINVPSGSVKSATAVYGTAEALNGQVYYAVALDDDATKITDTIDVGRAAGKWMVIGDASLAWTVNFDNAGGASGTHTDFIKEYLGELMGNRTEIENGTYTTETDVYFHIKAVDDHGNVNYAFAPFTVDPQGDRPDVNITYPKQNAVLGGEITIMGTATDNELAEKVGLYVDANNDGHWNWDDIALLNSDTDSGAKFGKLDDSAKTFVEATPVAGKTEEYYKDYALLLEVKAGSWSYKINGKGTFDPSGDGNNVIIVYAFAVDNKGNHSTNDFAKMQKVSFSVDKDSPKIENEMLVSDYTSGELDSAEIPYVEDMSVRGKWKYTALVYDDTEIATIKVDGVSVLPNGVPGVTVNKYDNDTEKKHGYRISIDIGIDDTSTVRTDSHTITFTERKDSGALSGSRQISINIDNKAPESIAHGDEGYNFKVYGNGIDEGRVVNMNGFYTFGSKAMENPVRNPVTGVVTNQTGISRIAFYVTRDVDDISNLYDVMIKHKASGNIIENYKTPAVSQVKRDADELYWRTMKVSSGGVGSITLTSAPGENVHLGGLVKFKGVYYTIRTISGSTIGLDTTYDFGNVDAGSDIKFAVASVVDNPTQELDGTVKNAAGYWTDSARDDGDGMIESLIKQGTSWIWEANINSKNIGDGVATIHYVVFDQAGNSKHDEVSVYVGNNLPRIAGLVFAADDNGDEVFDSNETYNQYTGIYEGGMRDGRNVVNATFPMDSTDSNPISIAKVRNSMKVVPEIVGGNGEISVTTSLSKRNVANNGWADAYVTLGERSLGDGTEDDTAKLFEILYDVKTMINSSKRFEDGDKQKMSMLFKDSTPGGSMEASVDVILDIALRDTVLPKIYIRPFYWKGSKDNSLFKNSLKEGHIEISSDLDFTGSKFTDANGLMDRDPKVSGKIRIEGIAVDNKQLKELSLKFNGTSKVIATMSNGVWTSVNTLSGGNIPSGGFASGEIEKATYGDLVDYGIIDEASLTKRKTAEVPFFTQEYGHVVKWSVYVDTSVLASSILGSGKFATTDMLVNAVAVDRGDPILRSGTVDYAPNTSGAESVQTGLNDGTAERTSHYRMDVVPYITGVRSELSRQTIGMTRSALGHYPLRTQIKPGTSTTLESGETVTVTGFNMNAAGESFNSKDYATSKAYEVTVNGVKSLNNLNNNDASGESGVSISDSSSYTQKTGYAYNRTPDNKGNDLLTDDVYFDVWTINSKVAMPLNGGKLDQMGMKVGPNGMLAFGFANGPLNFSLSNGMYNSYTGNKSKGGDFFTSVSFTMDDWGYSYGTAMPGNEGDKFRLISGAAGFDNNLETNGQDGESGKHRIRSPSMATTTAKVGTDYMTNLYMTYYDGMNSQIRFRRFSIKNGTAIQSGSMNSMAAVSGTYNTYANNKKDVHIVIGKDSAYEDQAGVYYNIGAIKGAGDNDDLLVFIWYDESSHSLKYMYHDKPSAITANTTTLSTINSKGNGGWSVPVSVFEGKRYSKSGEYCKIAVDANGGVHIASFEPFTSDLNYAYLDSSKSGRATTSADFKTCVVDSRGVVGCNLTLDVGLENSKPVPHIGYFTGDSLLPKYAYLHKTELLDSSSSDSLDGAVSDKVTGNWEITTVPTKSTVQMKSLQYNSINVGLFKQSGAIMPFPTSWTGSDNKVYSPSVSTANGTAYGNGSKNAILGYSIEYNSTNDYIETAQLK